MPYKHNHIINVAAVGDSTLQLQKLGIWMWDRAAELSRELCST
jgi:hypothetical protein